MRFGIGADVTDRTVPVTELARAVEDVGLEHLLLSQRIHLPTSEASLLDEPNHEMDANLLDPFVALTAAAVATSRILIGTGACYAALYDPITLAKQVATIDHISGGRFLFGVTPGWLESEVANHGIDPAMRWDVMREKVLAMRELWTGQDVGYGGRFVHFEPVRVGLRPLQKPYPPILVGSHGPRGMRHTVEYGDEWYPIVGPTTDLAVDLKRLAEMCLAAGREPVPVTAGALWTANEEVVERCAALGVRRISIYVYPTSRAVLDESLERIAALAARYPD